MLDKQRHCRGAVICAGGDYQLDLVDLEQLCVDAGDERRIALVVVMYQFDQTAQQPALFVDTVGPDLRGQQELPAACGAAYSSDVATTAPPAR